MQASNNFSIGGTVQGTVGFYSPQGLIVEHNLDIFILKTVNKLLCAGTDVEQGIEFARNVAFEAVGGYRFVINRGKHPSGGKYGLLFG